ncbi:S8 family serine peptidase [Ideonella sp. 4Y16]|uniref:S8 family serine peptidase n=1 Tax=Ideonella alba TaxID=2824118 RepID=A0A941BEH0_9BURK|nr:S8 family serine peptidase [Ideonella alba]MBQ0931126.1 S8 family serine peptidase [Ideonella alba]MBQ0944276.1 S8 family serine peptidase [Ideonella alba]
MRTLRIAPLTLALLALTAGLTLSAPATWAQSAKPRIEKAADLPRFSYPVKGPLETLVRQTEAYAPFAAALRRDIESVLAGYEIPDVGTRRDLLSTLAIMDFLDGRYDSALQRAELVRSLQDKPADKLISAQRLRAMASAAKQHALGSPAYREAVARFISSELAPLPYPVIANDIKGAKASAELIGEALALGRVREVVQPIADSSGAVSSEFAPMIVFARFALIGTLPLKQTLIDTYTAYLAQHQVAKTDIWAARDVALQPADVKAPVVLAVWDSGVDTALFGNQVVKDAQGQPQVIGYDKYARPANTTLAPIPAELRGKLPQMVARSKGFSDLQANIDSKEATEVKTWLSTLAPADYKAAIEEINLAGNYEHGTHVAGIAMAGNPGARLLVARIEFGHTLQPDPCPTREQTEREAASMHGTVAFLKQHGARVVNMSWGGNVKSIESDLEQCGLGKTPEDRKAMAREYFDLLKRAETEAMASAPGILFIAAGGNDNSDASFNEFIPSGIVLPNLLTVGAVDLAGDEASFTSYGPTVKVHANGYLVESYLPGGARVALSGTSMAAPQVANLAAKMLAVNPKLTPRELIDIIVATAEPSADGRRRLVHPKNAVAQARAR